MLSIVEVVSITQDQTYFSKYSRWSK